MHDFEKHIEKKPYHSLLAWKESHQFTLMIYELTDKFPKHELYGLTSQLRRSASSVAINIVEGYARISKKELLRFLDIATASMNESEYLLELAFALKYFSKDQYEIIEKQRSAAAFLLHRLIISKQI